MEFRGRSNFSHCWLSIRCPQAFRLPRARAASGFTCRVGSHMLLLLLHRGAVLFFIVSYLQFWCVDSVAPIFRTNAPKCGLPVPTHRRLSSLPFPRIKENTPPYWICVSSQQLDNQVKGSASCVCDLGACCVKKYFDATKCRQYISKLDSEVSISTHRDPLEPHCLSIL